MTETTAPIPTAVYEPLPWQVAPWRDTSRVVLLTGSAGGGKSRLSLEKGNAFCKRYPGAAVFLIRKTRESLNNSVIFQMQREVIPGDPLVDYLDQKKRFVYHNGSVMFCLGMNDEAAAQRVRSSQADMIIMAEANQFTEDDWTEVNPRLRGKAAPWRQILLDTNPDGPNHWINRRLINGGEAKVYYSSARDNTYNPDDYIDTLASMTGVKALRLRDGKWVQAEGAVYDEFDPAIHVIDSFDIPPDWRRYCDVDFGYTNPFVSHWWALDHDGRMYMYREIYRTQTRTTEHAQEMRRLSERERIEACVCDTEDANGRADINKYFMRTTGAKKGKDSVINGIERVKGRLAVQGDSKPRLFIMRGALVNRDDSLSDRGKPCSTAEEFPGYSWPKTVDGKAIKENPVDVDNHGMDAMRYLVSYLDPAQAKFNRQTKLPRV